MKQSANNWNTCISSKLKEIGYSQGITDPCLYIKHSRNMSTYVIIYVDDIVIATKNTDEIQKFEQELSEKFRMSKLGDIKEYSGIQVERDKEQIFYIHQRKYIEQILEIYGLKDAKGSEIPMCTGYRKVQNSKPLQDNTKFQSIIGSLMYIAVSTRPDIIASVSILSRKMKNPTETDMNEAKRIIKYLKHTINYRLKLGYQETEELVGYADADWAESENDRKSNSGYLFKYNGSSISWASRKQTCVALSSTEAEYIALSEACQEGLWLIKLLKDFDKVINLPIKMYEDNQSCISLTGNQNYSKRTKHVDTKYHFIRDLKEGNIIKLIYCSTEHMIADLLTKPIEKNKLKRLSLDCGLQPVADDDVEEEC